MQKHSYFAGMINAKATDDSEKWQEESEKAKAMTMKICSLLDHVAHPYDMPLIVAALEQYIILKKAGFTESQLKMVDLMKETFQLQQISVILPTQQEPGDKDRQ